MKVIAQALLLLTLTIQASVPTADTVTNSMGMKFKRIPSGSFQMGFEGRPLTGMALYNDHMTLGIYNEHPAHTVVLEQAFYMGIYEVSNTQFKQFRPDHGKDIPWYDNEYTAPANRMSWYAADSFCEWLTLNDPNGWTYRLPTEAEWEYGCRAGTTTWFSTGDTISTALANVAIGWGSSAAAKPVGSYPANPFGLFDMHGNAFEWCLDWYGPYPAGTATNPGGRISGDLKCMRGMVQMPFIRSAARGAQPPLTTNQRGYVGFRVVVSTLLKDNLFYTPEQDTLAPWQRQVALTRPAPLLNVSGDTFTDSDGRRFIRARINRNHFPLQWDSLFYVSTDILTGDSAASRLLAGLFAESMSLRNGVLYRITNRYEAESAHLTTLPGQFRLTILPDVKYVPSGWGHPDIPIFVSRKLPVVDTTWQMGGPLYWKVNHVPWLSEAPNGDLLMTFYSATSEDVPEQVLGISRLRLNQVAWDSITSAMDIPGSVEWGAFYKNRNGRLFQTMGMFYDRNWMARYSDDNGVSWSEFKPNSGMVHAFPMGGDSLLGCLWQEFRLSTDNGMTAKNLTVTPDGKGRSFFVDDDGVIRSFNRLHAGGAAVNDSGATTMGQDYSANLGESWTHTWTPFRVPGIGTWDNCIKLQSGRILFATGSAKDGKVIFAESEDQGRTWFCRRKLSGLGAEIMAHHKSMVQGKDGLIHLCSSYGSGTGNGNNPQITFSEQWLKEGTCLDPSEWAVTSSRGMIAACPTGDTMQVWRGATTSIDKNSAINKMSTLSVSPNPMNPSCDITFSLASAGKVKLDVYTLTGSFVTTIMAGSLKAGQHRKNWNASGKAAGVYVLRFKADGLNLIHKVVIAR